MPTILKTDDFPNLVRDLLFARRQLIYNGWLHYKVNSECYNQHPLTWNTLILSLEFDSALGLSRLLEEQYFGRSFNNAELDSTCKKLLNLRNGFYGHRDLSKLRNASSFFAQNQLNGTELLNLVDALLKRAIAYDDQFKTNMHVAELAEKEKQSSMADLKKWLTTFGID